MFKDYLKEREGFETFETEVGFMTYKVFGKEFYIRDMYIAPAFRRQRAAWSMADSIFQLARELGCEYVTGTIYQGAEGNDASLAAMLAYGFKISGWNAEKIVFVKGL